ncbi:MAG: ferrochelatase [Pseudomonadota bacterium]|nr:ferrochelatase [Pseudomonadota bacterium]
MSPSDKTAVVLFNLGGPDGPDAVRPFLFNLFNDPAIIGVPGLVRWALAQFISRKRAPVAQKIYKHLGGGSPLLPNTQAQAEALEKTLGGTYRVFVAMRYWHPFAWETVAVVKDYAPSRIVLLPLYPQFSTTTTGSSVADWHRSARKVGLDVPTSTVCCYFKNEAFVQTIAARVQSALDTFVEEAPRVLYTAHGLPKKVIAAGDPYQWQVKRTAAAITEAIGRSDLDWITCYQSRVGPLEWIQPYTSDVLKRAGKEKKPVIVVPIGFTSEHSETLVELDIEYREIANLAGVPRYTRIDTVGDTSEFIEGLAKLVRMSISQNVELSSDGGRCQCPSLYGACAFRVA